MIVSAASAIVLVLLAAGRLGTSASESSVAAFVDGRATSSTVVEAGFEDAINAMREEYGLAPLEYDSGLARAAQDWAHSMRNDGILQHATDVRIGAPERWSKVGENVGTGASVSEIMTAFERSDSHLQNLLDPTHALFGIGTVEDADGMLWTVHRFASVLPEG